MNGIEEQNYQNQKIDLKIWKKILGYAMKYKKYLIISVSIGCLTGVMDMASSLLSMWAIDGFIMPGNLDKFPVFVVLTLLLQILFAVGSRIFCYISGYLEAYMAADIRHDAFVKLQMLSVSYFDKTSVGYLLARLTNDVSRTIETIAWSVTDLGWQITSVIAGVIAAYVVNWRFALIVTAAAPIIALISIGFQKRILRFQRETRRLNSMVTSAYNEGIMGAKTTKTLVREKLNIKEFIALTADMRHASMRASMASALYMPVAALVVSLVIGVIMTRGGYDVLGGVMTVGELNFFINITSFMLEPIRMFARVFAELQTTQAAAERVIGVMEEKPEIVDPENIVKMYGDVFEPQEDNWEPINGDVELENITFRYGTGKGQNVLENFSLKVSAGQNIALVGETGSGKSTIVNLVCRFYEPQEGRVLIDGRDIRERSILWLQSRLGYVLQTPQLFSGSIRENIRYGKLDATDAEIENAAKMVGAHDFISRLEKGYDTEVGEGGGLISTGQKQLISFARAILANPAIFVLDEATSSVDTESELMIQKASEALLKNRTSFIIAHRLSTVRNADRILVIDGGKILEDGSHRELMAKKGRYYELYTSQFKTEREINSVKQI